MSRDDHHASLVSQLAEQHHQPPLEHDVQTTGGLVEQEHRRVPHELQAAGRASALASGEVLDHPLGLFDQPELGQGRGHQLGDRRAGLQAHQGGEAQGLTDGEPVMDALTLRHVAQGVDGSRRGLAPPIRGPGGRAGGTREHAHERGLARTARAHQRDQRSRRHLQRNRPQDPRAVPDAHLNVAGDQHRIRLTGNPADRIRRGDANCARAPSNRRSRSSAVR